MQPPNESVGAIAGKLRQLILFGNSLEEAVQTLHARYPQTPIGVIREAEATAAAEVAALTWLRQAPATGRLIEAFGDFAPTTTRVGVRYSVAVVMRDGSIEYRTVGYDAPVGINVALLEETIRELAKDLPSKGSGERLATREDMEGPTMIANSVLTERLPNRMP